MSSVQGKKIIQDFILMILVAHVHLEVQHLLTCNPVQVTLSYMQGTTVNMSISTSSVMLSTAVIYVHNATGQPHRCRAAVLDSESQLNFITSFSAQRFQLNKTNIFMPISGIGTMSSSTVRFMPCTISSHCQKYCNIIEFHLLSTITERLPSQIFDIEQLNIPDNMKNSLADPQFNIPSPVDILFGAELFYDIFLGACQ